MRNKTVITGILLFVLAGLPLMAGGQREREETRLDVERLPRVYIAPQNPETGNTELVLQPTIVPPTNAVIRSYELRIYDAAGQSVWSRSEEITERRGFFGRLFNIGEEPGIDLDVLARLSWPGVDQDGDFVEDGDYIYQLSVRDSEGNVERTPPMNVTVDNTAPTVDLLQAEYTIFSPDDSGIRDTLPIQQRGSREVSWVGRFFDNRGEIIREYTWQNPVQYDPELPTRQRPENDRTPEDFAWDGLDADGRPAPDGVYTYQLVGTDRAGNEVRAEISDIVLSTEAGDLIVRPSRRAFSPGTDSPYNTLTFLIEVSSVVDVAEWRLDIMAEGHPDRVLRSFSGEGDIDEAIRFDGNDNQGRRLPDGLYRVQLHALFVNGTESQSRPVLIEIDTVPPQARLSVDPPVFGGETRPTTTIDARWDPTVAWTGLVEAPGLFIRQPLAELAQQFGIDETAFPFEWDGTDIDGEPIPDGSYTAWMSAVDEAGNRGQSNRVTLTYDTRETPIALEVSATEFTPDFVGVDDTVTFTPVLEVTDSIERFVFNIRDEQDRVVRSRDTRQAFDEFVWNGRNNAGQLLPEGVYTAELTVHYANGNQPTATAAPVQLLISGVSVSITAPYDSFAPTGDGYRDTIIFTIGVAGNETVARWSGEIRDASNRAVRTMGATGDVPRSIEWDGTHNDGRIVDGRYTVHMRVEYASGGVIEGRFDGRVTVDTTGPEVDLSVSPDRFAPNGDGINDELTFTMRAVDQLSDIGDWELVIHEPNNNSFRTFSGSGAPPRTLSWDGRSDDGELVQSATRYRAVLTVRDVLRNAGSDQATVAVDIMVVRVGDRYRIVVPSIHFRPNTANMFQVEDEMLLENLRILRRLAEVFAEYSDYDILIEGHANHVLYYDPVLRDQEQQGVLIPLSRRRAATVREALAILGVDLQRMRSTGIGGARPEVDFSDYQNIWKNRRVEFWLDHMAD